jgi:hypothetical protein
VRISPQREHSEGGLPIIPDMTKVYEAIECIYSVYTVYRLRICFWDFPFCQFLSPGHPHMFNLSEHHRSDLSHPINEFRFTPLNLMNGLCKAAVNFSDLVDALAENLNYHNY